MENQYTLPMILDLKFIHRIFHEIKEKGVKEMIWDWKNCENIMDEAKCSLLHIAEGVRNNSFSVTHINKSSVSSSIDPILNYSIIEKDDFDKGIFISPINKEEALFNDKLKMENFLSYCFPNSNVSFTQLGNLFAELYMNICQHSEISKGYIYISNPDCNKEIKMCFSDLGVGIATKIKGYFTNKMFSTDAEAIDYATELYVTTKSGINNQGKGLDTIKTSTLALNGELEIYSGNGLLKLIGDKKEQIILNYEHLGSLITLKINIDNLEEEKDVDYNEEIDF